MMRDRTCRKHASVLAVLAYSSLLTTNEWIILLHVSRTWQETVHAVIFARSTLLVTHSACERHVVPRSSERPERLGFIMKQCTRRFPHIPQIEEFPYATIDQLTIFHSEVHVDTIVRLATKIERSMVALDEMNDFISPCSQNTSSRSRGGSFPCPHDDPPISPSSSYFVKRPEKPKSKATYYAQFQYIDVDADTILMRHTLDAAQCAAGAVCHAIDQVFASDAIESELGQLLLRSRTKRTRNAFCVVRPPGHHAEPQRAMGFCFFNNIGVGAFHALHKYGLDRVAIIDFDAHHGNGTQKRVEKESRLLYVSLHQSTLFPHTGFARETGDLYNNILNIPLPPRTSARHYRHAFLTKAVPRVQAFDPQLILISAGFDGHKNDPLSDMKLEATDFYWLTKQIVNIAWSCCQGRVVSVLEGGYYASALADSAEQHLLALVHGGIAP